MWNRDELRSRCWLCDFALHRESALRTQVANWARAALTSAVILLGIGTPTKADGQSRWRAYMLCETELMAAEAAWKTWHEDDGYDAAMANYDYRVAALKRATAFVAFTALHVRTYGDLPTYDNRTVGLPRTCSEALTVALEGAKASARRFMLSTPHGVDDLEVAQCNFAQAAVALIDATIGDVAGYRVGRRQRHADLVAAIQDQQEAYQLFAEYAGFAARHDALLPPETC